MEENNFNNVNNEVSVESAPEAPVESVVTEEPVVETKVEEVAAANNIEAQFLKYQNHLMLLPQTT